MYTHDYTQQAEALLEQGMDIDEVEHTIIAQFEEQAKEHLEGCLREDVGAVMLYMRNNKEVAFLDYELWVASVAALGGKRSNEACC